MIQLHFDANQLNIGKSTGVLHLFVWNYVNYANMEGFRRDSHIIIPLPLTKTPLRKILDPPLMYVATMAFVGVTSDHQWSSDTHIIICHQVQPPPTAQQTQQYNTHRCKLQIHLLNLPPLCHITTAWIIHTASYKLHLWY